MDYTPIISALFGPLLLFAVFAALVALLRLSFFGAIGEAAVSCRLRRHFAEVADGKRGLEKGARLEWH
jgi:hypothetical protein